MHRIRNLNHHHDWSAKMLSSIQLHIPNSNVHYDLLGENGGYDGHLFQHRGINLDNHPNQPVNFNNYMENNWRCSVYCMLWAGVIMCTSEFVAVSELKEKFWLGLVTVAQVTFTSCKLLVHDQGQCSNFYLTSKSFINWNLSFWAPGA